MSVFCCFTVTTSGFAGADDPPSVTGCVQQMELPSLISPTHSKICKYITVGDINYSVVVRSEIVIPGDGAKIFPNIKPVPTDKEVIVYGKNSPLGPSLNCMSLWSSAKGRITTSWKYKEGGKACPST